MTAKTNPKFNAVALTGRHLPEVTKTLVELIAYLQSLGIKIILEASLADGLDPQTAEGLPAVNHDELGQHADLLIVVGGDGAFLNAARYAMAQNLPMLGINRGRLGFLTDIHPNALEKIGAILAGDYEEEPRFLLNTIATHPTEGELFVGEALNETVIMPGETVRMIEYEIHINGKFVCTQRADGLILSTPTGSTAYSLSGGGPILHPTLDAIVLVPMFPHTLTSRPLVVAGSSDIEVRISPDVDTPPILSCDSRQRKAILPGTSVRIKKHGQPLKLVHPTDYNYYETLRAKLNWESKHYVNASSD